MGKFHETIHICHSSQFHETNFGKKVKKKKVVKISLYKQKKAVL